MVEIFRLRQRGQVLVLVLLVVLIGLTVGLSITARTLQDLRSTSVSDQSSRAFSAAEAGIEEALRTGAASGNLRDLGNKAGYSYTSVEAGGGTGPFIFPEKILHDDTQQVWLIAHDSDGDLVESSFYTASSIDICWGDDPADLTPALEVSVIYKIGSNYGIAKAAYDPNSGRAGGNGFTNTSVVIGGMNNCYKNNKSLAFKRNVGFSALGASGTLEAIRLRPLYNSSPISLGVAPVSPGNLPPQGKIISSTGKSDAGITRKVEVYKSYPSLPAIFDFVIFSGSTANPLSK